MIHKIKIKGYKSLDVDFELHPEVTVLVGRSGSGKSNFVEALRFLRDVLRDPNQIPYLSGRQAQIEALPKDESGFSLEFCVEYSVPAFSERICYGFVVRHDKRLSVISVSSERLSIGEEECFSRKPSEWTVPPKIQGYPKLDYRWLAFPQIHGIQKISYAYLALADLLGVYNFPLGVGQEKRQQPSSGKALSDNGENFRAVMDEIRTDMNRVRSWDDINASLQYLNKSIDAVDMTAMRGGDMRVTHKFGETRVSFPIEQESEGFRRFLVHLLALYQTPPKLTLVFEEPENGIHPGALQLLSDEFKDAPTAGRGQVILTTHNPIFLDCFTVENIRVVEMENFRTKISALNAEQLRAIKEDLIAPGEYLMFSGFYSNTPEVGS